MKELSKIYFNERKLIDAGLIAVSLIVLQVWIAGGTHDPASLISLISLAASMPLLVFDLLILSLPIKYGGKFYEHYSIGRILAAFGVVSAIWHVNWIGGIIFLLSGVYATILYFVISKMNEEEIAKMEEKKAVQSTNNKVEKNPQ